MDFYLQVLRKQRSTVDHGCSYMAYDFEIIVIRLI